MARPMPRLAPVTMMTLDIAAAAAVIVPGKFGGVEDRGSVRFECVVVGGGLEWRVLLFVVA